MNAYINGSSVVKKENFEKHLQNENHEIAALRLKENQILSQVAEDTNESSGNSSQNKSSTGAHVRNGSCTLNRFSPVLLCCKPMG